MIRRHNCRVKAYLHHQFRHLGCLVSQVASLPCTGVHDIHHLIRLSAYNHRKLRAGVTTQITCKPPRSYIIVMCAQDGKYEPENPKLRHLPYLSDECDRAFPADPMVLY